jgi:hypothetical protein
MGRMHPVIAAGDLAEMQEFEALAHSLKMACWSKFTMAQSQILRCSWPHL